MKFGVVVFPGSNCDQDMHDALAHDLGQEVEMLWHKEQNISSFRTNDCIVLPGGFSYGDYLRCGAMARFSPIMESVIEFANKGGKVLGVCNGFQVLCEAGLLPGALLANDVQKFVCKNIYLKKESESTLLTKGVNGQAIKIPIAHGEGRYYADEATMAEIHTNDQVLFSYCDEQGQINIEANPNGSLDNIAGITNKSRNVFGMMPHPERACSEILGNVDGRKIFEGLINQ
jgi:phosphoribosylformylglycinamidine synthase subunit PurQ / glutaminase